MMHQILTCSGHTQRFHAHSVTHVLQGVGLTLTLPTSIGVSAGGARLFDVLGVIGRQMGCSSRDTMQPVPIWMQIELHSSSQPATCCIDLLQKFSVQ